MKSHGDSKKKCKICGIDKEATHFYKHKLTNDGLDVYCKLCDKERVYKRKRTKSGLVSAIYTAQKSSSVQRGHNLPTYTRKELSEWLYSQKKFHVLYDNWVRLDYQKEYIPSVDRIDDYVGYTMSNIQLMTWNENQTKGHNDRRNGVNNKHSKAVIQLTLRGDFVAEYHSMNEAWRVTGIYAGGICQCCKGKSKKAGGFMWSYKAIS